MENQNLRSSINKITTSSFDNNYLAYLEKKFTEMNSELSSIYDSTLKEDNDNCDKNIEKAHNVIDIFKLLLDDTESVKKNIMEVMNPEFKEEMMKIEEEEKNFELDFDLSKIPIYNNYRKKNFTANKDLILHNKNHNINGIDNEKGIIFDLNDLNFLCGNIKAETKQVSEDINNLQNVIGNYKERIKDAASYVIPQANSNSSALRQHLNTQNLMNAGNLIGNVNKNITNFDSQQQLYSVNNTNPANK